jgi:sporulation protein YlmC with PRC-barrel domain
MTPLLVSVAASVAAAQEAPHQPPPAPVAHEAQARDVLRYKASQLIGCDISNSKGERLGEIQDIVLDAGKQSIAYAVIAFGGFLGMGEKYFAMPWQLIEFAQRRTDDKPLATLGLDKEALKTAPGFDKGKWPDIASPTWAKQVDDYNRRSRREDPRLGGKEPEGSDADGKGGVGREPAGKTFAHRRLTKVIGMDVVDVQHQKVADVEDLVVDTQRATVDGALLSFGGVLGLGEKLALVPADALTLDHDKHVFVLPCTKTTLEAMALPGGKWPALNNDDWLNRGRQMCAEARAEAVANGDVIAVDASNSAPVAFADAYDPKRLETVNGTITTIGSVRVGEAKEERVRLRVRARDGREVIVYAAPAAWEAQQSLGLRSGTMVEVSGSPAKHGTQTVLVAGSIAVDGKTARLRDDQGRATWVKK